MKTSEKLQAVLREEGQKLSNSPEFAKLRDFYAEMQSKGLVLKQEYSLPPLDTIGRSIYHQVNRT